ncbi:hypothetical protein AB0900_30885 [Streptomyces cellulosae]|jgi:hypothetical protein
MHRIRPHVGLILYALLGGTVGVGSALVWWHVLAPYTWRGWVLLLVFSGATAMVILAVLAWAQHWLRRPKHRRVHARPRPDTRKVA